MLMKNMMLRLFEWGKMNTVQGIKSDTTPQHLIEVESSFGVWDSLVTLQYKYGGEAART